ncbi:LexA family transcriptional regulator [uncultured Olegusella sp.]|uniref:LexA family protein n=1 Tax=uncultured Olegusella sp. TaxID=1979846 RepID=UPI00260619AF|nr:S24 family peptidase [uncultured Olegusella sp.]
MSDKTRLKAARQRVGMTQQDAADASGIPLGTIRRWEQGINEPDISSIIQLANLYRTTTDDLLGSKYANCHIITARPVDTTPVPVLGRIAAGTPREALAVSDETHDTPATLVDRRSRCFWLVVAGNSMNRLFPEGSLVLIDPDAEVRDGDVAAVFVNGDDATIKRVEYDSGIVTLYPESYDAEYRPRVIDQSDPDAPSFHAIGRVVSFTAPDGWRA